MCSRGRLISPSLPVGDDRYLNLNSQKRPTGRNLGEIVRYDALASRAQELLFGVLFAHAQAPSNSGSYHIRRNEMNPEGSSKYMTVFTSLTRASFLTCERISHLVG